jgi:dTDP-4-dehydrorhamnose 3,5-epimerase
LIETVFDGLLLIKLDVFPDDRGFFCETYHKEKFRKLGLPWDFVQDNQSYSVKNVIRGLHYQIPPFEQGKLIRVSKGNILDVAVDIRKDSPTYMKHYKCELNEDDFFLLWIPAGFAHGFATLSAEAIVNYKCTAKYSQEHERGLRCDDPNLGIVWEIEDPIVSDKDSMF